MPGGIGGERRNGRRSILLKQYPLVLPEDDMLFSRYVLFVTYMLMAVTGFGYLALTWSTVVLLGGFVTALQKEDFWSLTIISMMQAARIFNDLAEHLLPNFFYLVTWLIHHNGDIVRHQMWNVTQAFQQMGPWGALADWSTWARIAFVIFGVFMMLPFLAMCYVPALIYVYVGPIACIALALWRIVQRDYGGAAGGGDMNLAPALDMFYSLVLLQGGLYLVWLYVDSWWLNHLIELRHLWRLPSTGWCRLALLEYLLDTRARCWRDLSSIHGRTVGDYAADLLDSQRSWEENLSRLRLLNALVMAGTADGLVRSLLLPSRPKLQKLIDMLGCRHSPHKDDGKEMRGLAAHILAHLAGDIHLAQFPGALRCISSSLLQEENKTCWNGTSQQQGRHHHQQSKLPPQKQAMLLQLERKDRELEAKFWPGKSSRDSYKESRCHELVLLHGLTILRSLASDHQNCREICSTPGLLPKITAPLYSDTLIRDTNIREWANIVSESLKVVLRLIHAPGKAGRRLRREISSSKQAVSNLKSIVLNHYTTADQELYSQCLEMLTELALDPYVNLTSSTKEYLIKKQMQIFLAVEEVQEPDSLANQHQVTVTAGRTLVLITTNSQTNSEFIMRAYHGNILARLAGLLSTKKNAIYRTIAAEILENLCTHCDWNEYKLILTESLLPKVLVEIMSIRIDQPESKISEEKTSKSQAKRWLLLLKRKNYRGNQKNYAAGNNKGEQKNSAPGKDEENQQNFQLGSKEQSHKNCAPGEKNQIQEISSSEDQNKSYDQQNEEEAAPKELQEALLSLALVICGKLITARDAVQLNALGGEAFVMKLKAVISGNCQPTADSLRIVKLCGRIAAAMMQCQLYAELFRNKEFVQSLSKASKIMSCLESRMLFAGNDFGLQKTIRPLLYELEKEVYELEKKAEHSS
ncbi:unnamed protein product [Urochloa humidicola]